jgi:hypothetical protein
MKGIRIVKEQYQTGDLTFKGNTLPVETPGSVWYMNRKKRKEHFMSQLIACQNAHGIVLATDGKAIDFDPSGKMIELKVDRLVQIGKHVAILTGGAADGVAMCHALKSFLNEEKLDDIQDVYGAYGAKSFPWIPSTTSTSSWEGTRPKTHSVRSACICSGRRKSFLNSMAMRSPSPTPLLESWAWSTG